MRWAAAVVWRVLLSNPWNLPGSESAVLDMGVRRLRLHMVRWFQDAGIPRDRRIGDLTLTMLGAKRGCVVRGDHPHPGTVLKTKAAETGIMFEWALNLLQSEFGGGVQHREHLVVAGRALQRWLDITRTDSLCLSLPESQELRDCAQRHLVYSRRAMIALVPKHHFLGTCLSERKPKGILGCMRASSTRG